MTLTGMRHMRCACGRRYHVPAYAAREKLLCQCGRVIGKKEETVKPEADDDLQKTNNGSIAR